MGNRKKKKSQAAPAADSKNIFSKQLGMPGGQEGALMLADGRFGSAEHRFQVSAVLHFTTNDGAECLAVDLIAALVDAVGVVGGDPNRVLEKAAAKCGRQMVTRDR